MLLGDVSHILIISAHPNDSRSRDGNECLGSQQEERTPLAVEALPHAVRPPMKVLLNGTLEEGRCVPQLGPCMHLQMVHALTQRPLPLTPGVIGCSRESRQAQR